MIEAIKTAMTIQPLIPSMTGAGEYTPRLVKAKESNNMLDAAASPLKARGAGMLTVMIEKMMMIQIRTGMFRKIST